MGDVGNRTGGPKGTAGDVAPWWWVVRKASFFAHRVLGNSPAVKARDSAAPGVMVPVAHAVERVSRV